jgi:hypothetical protein
MQIASKNRFARGIYRETGKIASRKKAHQFAPKRSLFGNNLPTECKSPLLIFYRRISPNLCADFFSPASRTRFEIKTPKKIRRHFLGAKFSESVAIARSVARQSTASVFVSSAANPLHLEKCDHLISPNDKAVVLHAMRRARKVGSFRSFRRSTNALAHMLDYLEIRFQSS